MRVHLRQCAHGGETSVTMHAPAAYTCHRVGVAFSEGPELLPFYENLAKWPLLPLYAHILSVSFTVLPRAHIFFYKRGRQVKSSQERAVKAARAAAVERAMAAAARASSRSSRRTYGQRRGNWRWISSVRALDRLRAIAPTGVRRRHSGKERKGRAAVARPFERQLRSARVRLARTTD